MKYSEITMPDEAGSRRAFDETTGADYVRELFRCILQRAPGPAELAHWVDFVLATQDGNDLLRRFCDSEEYKSRIGNVASTPSAFPAGHFYSTIPNLVEVKSDRKRIFERADLLDVDLNIEEQTRTVGRIVKNAVQMPFSDEADGRHRYYYNNTSFAYGDAFFYWGMLADLKPTRLIEVGSGFTSALALDAIDFLRLDTTCTFIDPFPALLKRVAQPVAEKHLIVPRRVQEIDPEMVRMLGVNDILFIDSSHVVKAGSDVHFELTALLPRLNKGVIVHFHDMFYPFEYPEKWITDDHIYWNELYFLRAFLAGNNQFEIVLFNDFVGKEQTALLVDLSPDVVKRIKLNPGGGLWLRRL